MQREKIIFELVKPYIAGFSVEPMEIDVEEQLTPNKRKTNESTTMTDTSATAPSNEATAKNLPSKATGKKNKKPKK